MSSTISTTTVTNELLAYAPELKELVKSAEQVDSFSTASKGETLFSYVKVGFMEKVAGLPVPANEKDRVLRASTLYGIEKTAQEIVNRIASRVHVKKASELEKQAGLMIAQDNFEAMESGYVNPDRMVKIARALRDTYEGDITSDSIKHYACDGYLSKSAALRSLKARYSATKNEAFEKLAEALDSLNTDSFTLQDKRKFADFIHGLDKKAELTSKGFNVYKEIFLTKSAAIGNDIQVNLGANKSVSVLRIQAMAPDLAGAIGADVVKEIQGDPLAAKHAIEALPMDIKGVIARYV